MAVPPEGGADGADGGKYGSWGSADALGVPVVANLFSLPVHNTLGWTDTDKPNKYLVYDRQPKLHRDEQGRYDVVLSGQGDGLVVLAPPQLQDYHSYGDGFLRGAQWPLRIGESTLLLLNGAPSGAGPTNAISRLAFGLAYPTSTKPKLGWYFDYQPSSGAAFAETLSLIPTDDEAVAIASAGDYPDFDIKANAHVYGKLTVDGIIDPTGLVLTEQASTPWAFAAGYGAIYVKNTSPSTLIFVDDTGAEFTLGAGGSGDVVGPASAVDKAAARFDTTTGKLIQNSGLIIDDVAGSRLVIHTENNGAGDSNDLRIDVGSATGTAGSMAIGLNNAESTSVGRTTKTTTLRGTLEAAELVNFIGAYSGAGGDDVAVGRVCKVRITSGATLTGMVPAAGGTAVNGQVVFIENATGATLTVSHDATSAAANRFYCPSSTNLSIPANGGIVVEYSTTDSRWRVVSIASASGGSGLTHPEVMARGVFGGPF
jgi:hypothetical protein